MTLSREIVQQRLDAKHGNIKLIGEFTRAQDKSEFLCSCGHKFVSTVISVTRISGCPACGLRKSAASKRKTKEEVQLRIDAMGKGIKIIGEYLDQDTKTTFLCRNGHEFISDADAIIHSRTGCPICYLLSKPGTNSSSREEIERRLAADGRGLRIVGEYVNARTKTKFLCPLGHEWETVTDSVIRGTGCPMCSSGGFKHERPGILYFVLFYHESISHPLCKVGITNKDVEERVHGMFKFGGVTHKVIGTKYFDDGSMARHEERRLHKKYAQFRYSGDVPIIENGKTELFTVNIMDCEGLSL